MQANHTQDGPVITRSSHVLHTHGKTQESTVFEFIALLSLPDETGELRSIRLLRSSFYVVYVCCTCVTVDLNKMALMQKTKMYESVMKNQIFLHRFLKN